MVASGSDVAVGGSSVGGAIVLVGALVVTAVSTEFIAWQEMKISAPNKMIRRMSQLYPAVLTGKIN